MAIYWTEYKGKQIFVADYRKLPESEMLDQIKEVVRQVTEHEGKLLIFTRMEGCMPSSEFLEFTTKNAKYVLPKFEKYAVTGMSGLKKIFMNSFALLTNSNHRSFDSEIEALEYLVS